MISTSDIIYSFIISIITIIFLKGYEKANEKDYETSEYIKVFLITLLSSIATFYIKTLINPLISKMIGGSLTQSIPSMSGGKSSNIGYNNSVFGGALNTPSSIPNLTSMDFTTLHNKFKTGTPTF